MYVKFSVLPSNHQIIRISKKLWDSDFTAIYLLHTDFIYVWRFLRLYVLMLVRLHVNECLLTIMKRHNVNNTKALYHDVLGTFWMVPYRITFLSNEWFNELSSFLVHGVTKVPGYPVDFLFWFPAFLNYVGDSWRVGIQNVEEKFKGCAVVVPERCGSCHQLIQKAVSDSRKGRAD